MAITLPGLPITKSFMSIPIFVNKCYNESEENNDISYNKGGISNELYCVGRIT